MKSSHGFTLIELLIVVAIIAILAAIAVPNFLEAQVRAKTSRELADMRSIKTALESYRVDNSDYPPTSRPGMNGPTFYYVERYRPLTTPIAYMSAIPHDVFCIPFAPDRPVGPQDARFPRWPAGDPANPTGLFNYWTLASALDHPYNGHPIDYPYNYDNGWKYELRGYGPDQTHEGININTDGPMRGLVMEFDPTNGTVSRGDIIMFGPG